MYAVLCSAARRIGTNTVGRSRRKVQEKVEVLKHYLIVVIKRLARLDVILL